MSETVDVAIIVAGIVGAACAEALSRLKIARAAVDQHVARPSGLWTRISIGSELAKRAAASRNSSPKSTPAFIIPHPWYDPV